MKSDIVVADGKAYHIGVRAEEMAPTIFQVGDPKRAYLVAERFDRVEHECVNREFVTLTGTLGGKRVSVMGTGIGHDNVEIALLEAYTLLAFDLERQVLKPQVPEITVLRIGTSGGAQGDIEPGTLGISSYALGLDSTGLYFDVPVVDETAGLLEQRARKLIDEATDEGCRFRGSIHPYATRATPELVATLEERAQAAGLPVATGVTVAAPGFYGASGRNIEPLKLTVPGIKEVCAEVEANGHRVINFEMESSLIFLLAQALGWRAATICPIISNPKRHDSVIDYGPAVSAAIDLMVEV